MDEEFLTKERIASYRSVGFMKVITDKGEVITISQLLDYALELKTRFEGCDAMRQEIEKELIERKIAEIPF